jgi:hypothetical protein
MHCRQLILAVSVIVSNSTPLCAQGLDRLVRGSYVRVAECDGAVASGRFQSVHADTLALESDSVTSPVGYPIEKERIAVALPLARLCTYQIFEGYGRHPGRGALIGAALGLVIVSAAVAVDKAQTSDGPMIPATAIAIPLALVTTGLGALIGARGGAEIWSAPRSLQAGTFPRTIYVAQVGVRWWF